MIRELKPPSGKPRVNFRPVLYFALGLVFGIFLYTRIRFGGWKPSDLLFVALFPLLSIRPASLKRAAAIFLSLLIFAGAGVLAVHLYTQSFLSGRAAGDYEITATVNTFTVGNGYTDVTLSRISLNGERVSGKMRVRFSTEELRAGDILSFKGSVSRTPLPGDSYGEYLFANDIRYTATASEEKVIGKSGNVFLRLNTSLYNVLHAGMDKHEADVGYALLTGNSGCIDDGLLTAVRQGGIAHVFAVSGLHIGILFGAVMFVCKRLGKYKFLPAAGISILYCALCGFTVSSVRAVIMASALSLNSAFGRKSDFLNSVAFAALSVLLFLPAQFLSVGFRLSFGACLGLALFSNLLSRGLRKLPRVLKNYLSATASVQLFTFPVLYDSFGYFSVWGLLLNFIFIPLLPAVFLGLFLCSAFALIIPPAAAFFLAFPEAMLALLLYAFSVADFSLVITGFSLGAGSVVWLIASVVLSDKVRLSGKVRAIVAACMAVLFVTCVCVRNVVITGCKVTVEAAQSVLLIRTKEDAVLILGNGATLKDSREFLNRNYGGTLSAVIVTTEDVQGGVNVAAFLPAEQIYVWKDVPTGLRQTEITCAEVFSVGEMSFRYESASKLAVLIEHCVTEVDFASFSALGADLFLGDTGGTYLLKGGSVYRIYE